MQLKPAKQSFDNLWNIKRGKVLFKYDNKYSFIESTWTEPKLCVDTIVLLESDDHMVIFPRKQKARDTYE